MRQAFHIFSKDVRCLRLEILVVLVLCSLFAWLNPELMLDDALFPVDFAGGLVLVSIPLAWWIVISQLVRQEQIPGVAQFWLTRPIHWGSLLGAKLLFIAVFLNSPLFIAQCVIVKTSGFDLMSQIPTLLWMQVSMTVRLFLALLALEAATRNVRQVLLIVGAAVLCAALAFVLGRNAPSYFSWPSWRSIEWLRNAAQLVFEGTCFGLIVLVLYSTRRVSTSFWLATCLLGEVVLIATVPAPTWNWPFRVREHFSARPVLDNEIRISTKSSASTTMLRSIDGSAIWLPFQVEAIPEGMSVQYEDFIVEIDSGRELWKSGLKPWTYTNEGSGPGEVLLIEPDSGFFNRVEDSPVTLRGSIGMTLLGKPIKTRLSSTSGDIVAPGFGILHIEHFNLKRAVEPLLVRELIAAQVFVEKAVVTNWVNYRVVEYPTNSVIWNR